MSFGRANCGSGFDGVASAQKTADRWRISASVSVAKSNDSCVLIHRFAPFSGDVLNHRVTVFHESVRHKLFPLCLAVSGFLMMFGGSNCQAYNSFADSQNFTLDTAGVLLNVGGAAQADSANFTLDTAGLPENIGGPGYADSANFLLNTAANTPAAIGGSAYADSANFLLNTAAGTIFAVGGTSQADSANFTLNTRVNSPAAIGGFGTGDSVNFTLNTRAGSLLAIGGSSFADSANFTLDTGGAHPHLPTLLGLGINGSNLIFSWPTSAGNYNLQATTNLSHPNWTNVPNSPATVGSNYVSTNPFTSPIQFFRLKSY